MKLSNIKYMAVAAVAGVTLTACEDFLDRPSEDTYNVDNFYKTDEQFLSSVNYLYNSPWARYALWRGHQQPGPSEDRKQYSDYDKNISHQTDTFFKRTQILKPE